MAVLSNAELSKSLRQGELFPVYFLYGEETWQMEKCLAAIIKKTVGRDSSCFNLQQFDGSRASIAEILDAAEAYPVMANKKCVTVGDLNIEKLADKDYNLLKELIKDPPETTVLVLYHFSLEINPKKSNKYKTLIGLIEKSGCVGNFDFLTHAQLEKLLVETAAKSGCTLSGYLAGYLIDRCGDSLAVLMTEIEKLCCFTDDGGEISKEAVDALTAKSMDASAFDLSKAILKQEYGRAFHILSELFDQQLEPLAILGALNVSFAAIYKSAAARTEQVQMSTVIADFGYKGREFQIRNAFRDCSSFSIRQIRQCIAILAEADRKLKSSRIDQQTLLEFTLTQMMALK